MTESDTVIDIDMSTLTKAEVLGEIAAFKVDNPGYDVFLDGDTRSILARRCCS